MFLAALILELEKCTCKENIHLPSYHFKRERHADVFINAKFEPNVFARLSLRVFGDFKKFYIFLLLATYSRELAPSVLGIG